MDTATSSTTPPHRPPFGPDPRAAAITGLTTLAWYAVPDLVGPRAVRAAAKAAVATTGAALIVATTAEGKSARSGVRSVIEAAEVGTTNAAADNAAADNGDPRDGDRDRDRDPAFEGADPRLVAGAVSVAVLASAAVAVAGEKCAYRLGERWRRRGAVLPHTRVGLLLGALAVGVTLLEPRRVVEHDER